MGPGVPVHIGIVPGAQLPGEEDGGAQGVHLLAQLLPEVESFQAETQRLRDMATFAKLEQQYQQQENAEIRKELSKERNRNFEQNMKISALTQRCKRAEKLLEKVPPEVLEHIKRKATARER